MSKPRHHPRSETLANFAAGRLDEALSVVIAAHTEQCAACANTIGVFETVGGAILEETAPVAMNADALENILAMAGAHVVSAHHEMAPASVLDPYLGGSLDNIPWRWVAPGVHQHVMAAQGYRDGVLRLVKFAPGKGVPHHSHTNGELTLLLRGAYRDGLSEWRAGDLSDLDHDHVHEPIAFGDEPCICLIATAGPLKFKTLLGKAMQPFVGL